MLCQNAPILKLMPTVLLDHVGIRKCAIISVVLARRDRVASGDSAWNGLRRHDRAGDGWYAVRCAHYCDGFLIWKRLLHLLQCCGLEAQDRTECAFTYGARASKPVLGQIAVGRKQ